MDRSRATLHLAVALVAVAVSSAPVGSETVALLPVQDRAGDSAVARTVAATLRQELALSHEVVAGEVLRDALRRRRIRSVDAAPPALLRELAAEVGADRFLTVVVHEAERDVTPRLALSARSYDAASGEVRWAAFESGSGLDGRTVLGLGVVDEADLLAERLARRLLDRLAEAGAPSPPAGRLGRVALVSLSGLSESDATRAAETVTEIVRATLMRRGVSVLSPNRAFEAMYGRLGGEPLVGWGAVDATTRRALWEAGAELIITGSVERWETAGDGLEPEPVIAVALRAVDAESGRIVWTGALDRRGWDGETVFRLGRIWDHGTLGAELIDRLARRLTKELATPRAADESRRTTP